MCIKAKATLTNNTYYSCHTKAVELVKPIILGHIMSLVVNSLREATPARHMSTSQTKAIIKTRHVARLGQHVPGLKIALLGFD